MGMTVHATSIFVRVSDSSIILAESSGDADNEDKFLLENPKVLLKSRGSKPIMTCETKIRILIESY